MEKQRVQDIQTNYDTVFKDALSLFKNKALDFFNIPGDAIIVEPLRTEKAEIHAEVEFSDLTFSLSNKKGFHVEEEVDLSKDDLLRICGYHIDLVRAYKREFITVIFIKNPSDHREIDYEMLWFKPIIIDCNDFDADIILDKLKSQIQNNEEPNELEIIYLPLFSSKKYSPEELLRESISLTQKTNFDEDKKLKMIALSIIVSNKVVNKQLLEEIWEEVRMMGLKFMEVIEEKGVEIGVEKGVEKGVVIGVEKGVVMGVEKTINIINLFDQNRSFEETARQLNIPEQEVRDVISRLSYSGLR
jgi:hypothetical protein